MSIHGNWNPIWNFFYIFFISACVNYLLLEILSADWRRVSIEAWWCCKHLEMLGSCVTYPKQPSKCEGETTDRKGKIMVHRHAFVYWRFFTTIYHIYWNKILTFPLFLLIIIKFWSFFFTLVNYRKLNIHYNSML